MRLDRTRVPAPGAVPAPTVPRPNRMRLDNGMSLVSVCRDGLPEATLSLVLPAGAHATRAGTAGLASLVAKVLPEGASGRGAREMAVWIDGLGLQLGVSAGYDSLVLRVRTLSERLVSTISLFSRPTVCGRTISKLARRSSSLMTPSTCTPEEWANALAPTIALFG